MGPSPPNSRGRFLRRQGTLEVLRDPLQVTGPMGATRLTATDHQDNPAAGVRHQQTGARSTGTRRTQSRYGILRQWSSKMDTEP